MCCCIRTFLQEQVDYITFTGPLTAAVMGNKASLAVILDSNAPVMAGDCLKGNLLVEQGDKSCQGCNVQITIYGKEIVMLYSENHQLRRAEECFFQTTQTVRCSHGNRSKSNKCVLPFQIQLPESLPSSTVYPSSRAGFRKGMRIEYTLVAEMGTLCETINFQCQSTLVPTTRPVPCLFPAKSFCIRTLCVQRGQVTVTASIDNTLIGRGQALPISIALVNDSTVPILEVSVKLLEHVYWKLEDNGRIREETTTIVLDTARMEGLPAQLAKKRRRGGRQTSSAVHSADELRGLNNSLSPASSRLTLTVPASARDSHQGTLLRVWHTVRIKLLTPSMTNNVYVSLWVKIASRPGCSPPTTFHDCVPNLSPVSSQGSSALNDSYESTSDSSSPQSSDGVAYAFPPSLSDLLIPDADEVEPCHGQQRHYYISGSNIPVANAVPCDNFDENLQRVKTGDFDDDAVLAEGICLDDLVPLPPPNEVSLPSLLHQMACTDDPHGLVQTCLQDGKWVNLMLSLSPSEMGRIVAQVPDSQLQYSMRTLLASYVTRGR
ncbi:hypothetical protein MPSEU_000337200 [Mayamaea pseudoterrestris]|nr:hypothetical protein MPSEU_000337200 [Mayamaea pseudoterrestris]